MDVEGKTLVISDFECAEETEIVKNPYKFLNLSEDAPLGDARRQYIRLSKRYAPDMISPKRTNVRELYSDKDAKLAGLECSVDELQQDLSGVSASSLAEMLKHAKDMSEGEKSRAQSAFDRLRTLANHKMQILNRAYEEIKGRASKEDLVKLCGYEFEEHYDEWMGQSVRTVKLEANAELLIVPEPHRGWSAGPVLMYDYGMQERAWEGFDLIYNRAIHLKHLFAHMELLKGQRISPILLEPFAENYGLTQQDVYRLIDELAKDEFIDHIADRFYKTIPEKRFWSSPGRRFWHEMNEIGCLTSNPEEQQVEIEDPGEIPWEEQLTLRSTSFTTFKEADLMLLTTLAYGKLIKPREGARELPEA